MPALLPPRPLGCWKPACVCAGSVPIRVEIRRKAGGELPDGVLLCPPPAMRAARNKAPQIGRKLSKNGRFSASGGMA